MVDMPYKQDPNKGFNRGKCFVVSQLYILLKTCYVRRININHSNRNIPTHLTNQNQCSFTLRYHNDVRRDQYRFHAGNFTFLSIMPFAKLLYRTSMDNTKFTILPLPSNA